MNYTQSLTLKEQDVTEFLPATYEELADNFGFSRSAGRDHIAAIKRKGAPIASRTVGGNTKEFYMRDEEKEHPTNQNDSDSYGSVHKQASKTKKLNSAANSLTNRLDELLNKNELAVSSVPHSEGGDEDVAIHVTDDHIGDKLEDEFGNVKFDTEIAIQRIKHRVNKTFEIIERQRKAGFEFHTAHYVMGGDIMTGSGIYPGQSWEVEKTFNEQIDIATEIHFAQIQRLAEEFESVQVITQSGNHGEIKISGSSQEANGDDIIYRMLDALVRVSDLDNVTVIRNDSTNFTNFTMRGHNGHIRHGDNAQEHIGTSASKRDWRGWKLQHGFDIAYAGHYHIQGVDRVQEAPVMRSGSIKPNDDFEESISEWSMPASTIHGVSDSRPKTWQYDVNFAEA